MNKKTVLIHVGLVVVGVALALFASSSEKTSKDSRGQVKILELTPSDIESVRYVWPQGEVFIDRKGLKKNDRARASLEHEPSGAEKKKLEEEAKAKGAEVADPAKRKTYKFFIGERAQKSLSRMTPFKGRRSLGKVSDETLKKMEFDPLLRTLEIKTKRGTFNFDIGAATYGNRARYLRRRGEGEVFLIPSDAVSGLEGTPPRLQEARVLHAPFEAIKRMTVASKESAALFEHYNPDDAKTRFFAAENSDKKHDEATALANAMRALRLLRYLDEGEAEGGTLKARVRFDVQDAAPFDVGFFEREQVPLYVVEINGLRAILGEERGKQIWEELSELEQQ